jgi:membrane protein YqaA with SNARE-associated domain
MNITAFGVQLNEWASSTVDSLGYLGIFIVSFVGSASIILPIPVFIIVPAAAALPWMNPWFVGLSAGFGAALGEITGYALGKGGGKVIEKKYSDHMKKYRSWFKKDNIFIWIVIFAATPLPDDVLGLICGMFNYDFKKFIMASVIGKCILNLLLAFAGFYTIPWALRLLGINI